MAQYELLVGEPWDFKGPDGQNRVLLNLVRKVTISSSNGESKEYILLKVINPFKEHEELVESMIAIPRYSGQTIDEIIQLGGMVGVARIHQGVPITEDRHPTLEEIVYSIIGQLNRLPKTN